MPQYDIDPKVQKGFGPGELAGQVTIANLALLNPNGVDGRYTVKRAGTSTDVTIPLGTTEQWVPPAAGSLTFKNTGTCRLRISW
jgi:hypothetical protein